MSSTETPNQGGAPAPAAPAAAAPQTPPSTPPAGASIGDWTTGLNDDLKGFVQNKGFKTSADVLDSYRNLEKLVGAPKEKILKLPDNMEDPQAMSEIYSKLGRPGTANDYKIDAGKDAPESDKQLADFFKNTFFENGLTTKQAQGFMQKFNEFVTNTKKAGQEQFQQKLAEQETSLKKEWGAAYEQKVSTAKRAAREFGMEATQIDALEKALGFDGVMKFLDKVGSKIGEGSFHSGQSGNNGFAMTPDAAKSKIAMLKHDQAFIKRLHGGDASAKTEWENAHKMAYPDT